MYFWNTRKKVIFLHKAKKGVFKKSYAIHVADLSGMPKNVLKDAKKILKSLKKKDK